MGWSAAVVGELVPVAISFAQWLSLVCVARDFCFFYFK